jgi:hypothetical protein
MENTHEKFVFAVSGYGLQCFIGRIYLKIIYAVCRDIRIFFAGVVCVSL